MRRLCSLLLAALLCLSLVCPALAADVRRSDQKLSVDGQNVRCEKYNVDGSNYFKLRDLAALLSGTGSQFNVDYDRALHAIVVTTGQPYTTPDGTELRYGPDRSAAAVPSTQTLVIDGVTYDGLSVWNLGGSNYFKLRELGELLGFGVDYDKPSRTALVESRKVSARELLRDTAAGARDERGRNRKRFDIPAEEAGVEAAWSVALAGDGGLLLTVTTANGVSDGLLELRLPEDGGACPLRFVLQGGGVMLSAEGTLDPGAVPAFDEAFSLPFSSYDGPEELRASAEGSAGALLRLLLLRVYTDLLYPGGARLSSLGFTEFLN